MFPLPSLRAECLTVLGFDGFFPTWLNSENTTFAILFPRTSFHTPESMDIVGYIKSKITSYGCCSSVTWHDEKVYSLYDNTYILGPHVEFVVSPDTIIQKHCSPPTLMGWTIAHVAYDDMNPVTSYNNFNVHLYEAAFPTDYATILEELKARAIASIKDLTS